MSDLNPALLLEQRETSEIVRRAIDTLPEHERIAIVLFYNTGYTLKDIAAFLEVPPTTVKKRLYDARQHLKTRLRSVREQQLTARHEDFPAKVQLLIAVRAGDTAQVRAMLDKHPLLINAKSERFPHISWIATGLTPLYEAASNGNTVMTQLLLEYGATIHTKPYDALKGAVQANHRAIVQLLLASGANADAHPQQGQFTDTLDTFTAGTTTPLSLAAMKGLTDIVALLLAHGATVNATGPSGRTPLHWAALKGHLNIVSLLLAHGADTNARDELGRTPYDWAVERGQHEVITLLQSRQINESGAWHPQGSATTMT